MLLHVIRTIRCERILVAVLALCCFISLVAQPSAALPPTEIRQPGIEANLPADTVAYLRISNLPYVWKTLEQSGTEKAMLRAVTDEGVLSEPDALALFAWVKQAQQIHVVFHGAALGDDTVFVDMAVLIETGDNAANRQPIPAFLLKRLRKAGTYEEVPYYEMPLGEELAREGFHLFIAEVGSDVLVATSRRTMVNALRDLFTQVKPSLADEPTFRRLSTGMRAGDIELYASGVGVIDTLERIVERHDRNDLRVGLAAFGAEELAGAFVAVDFTAAAAEARVLADPQGRVFRILGQPSAPLRLPDYLPASTWILLNHNIGDGPALWATLREHIVKAMIASGEFPDPLVAGNAMGEAVAEFERETGIRVDEIAAQLKGLGIAFFDSDGGDEPAIIASVSDAAAGRTLVERMNVTIHRNQNQPLDPPKTVGRKGMIVGAGTRDIQWAGIDQLLFLSGHDGLISHLAKSYDEDRTLARSEAYATLKASLPTECTTFAFLQTGKLIELAFRYEWQGMPAAMQEYLRGLAHAGWTTCEADGLITVRAAASRPIDWPKLLEETEPEVRRPVPPPHIMQQEVTLVDSKTGELVTQTRAAWGKLGSANGRYKNPQTGQYTMVAPIRCAACAAQVPPPEFPADATAEQVTRALEAYRCPKCGKRAFLVPGEPNR